MTLIDCLDRHDPFTTQHPEIIPVHRRYGTGKYPRVRIGKPPAYAGMPRHYYRYGIHPGSFRQQLMAVEQPALIWVTSMMTYWYPGVQETIRVIREVFPITPVWLGGSMPDSVANMPGGPAAPVMLSPCRSRLSRIESRQPRGSARPTETPGADSTSLRPRPGIFSRDSPTFHY